MHVMMNTLIITPGSCRYGGSCRRVVSEGRSRQQAVSQKRQLLVAGISSRQRYGDCKIHIRDNIFVVFKPIRERVNEIYEEEVLQY